MVTQTPGENAGPRTRRSHYKDRFVYLILHFNLTVACGFILHEAAIFASQLAVDCQRLKLSREARLSCHWTKLRRPIEARKSRMNMANEPIKRFEKLAHMHKCIDAPWPDQAVYDQCISIAGWIFAEERAPAACRVRAWLEGAPIGETRLLFVRPDVSDFLSLPHDVPTAFRFLACAAGYNEAARDATIELTASWEGDAVEYLIGKVSVHLVPAFLQKRHFGNVVFPAQKRLLHRENIYGSGPPVLEPAAEMLRFIFDYLSPRSSVLDVGCGAGAYGPALITAGHQWTGLEIDPNCLQMLEERGLPFRKIAPETEQLPCEDEEFDEVMLRE